MRYFNAQDLTDIQNIMDTRVYVLGKVEGYLNDIDINDLKGYVFSEVFYDEDDETIYVEIEYWDRVFTHEYAGHYYNLIAHEVYGEWSVDRYDYEEDDETVHDENITWDYSEIQTIMVRE